MHQPYFKKFTQCWPIEEFLKSQLKNRHAYARKHGFLEDITSSNILSGDDVETENEDFGAEDEVVDEVDESGLQEEEEGEEEEAVEEE